MANDYRSYQRDEHFEQEGEGEMANNTNNDRATGKPPHIENAAKLAAALKRQIAQHGAGDVAQAAKQARQHQRLNALAERVNKVNTGAKK